MKSERLFRGALTSNSTWVFGGVDENKKHIVKAGEFLKVFPDTIGQYTGCKDKRGKLLYEGDIIEVNRYKLKHKPFKAVIEYYPLYCAFSLKVINPTIEIPFQFLVSENSEFYTKLGNRFENPELLNA